MGRAARIEANWPRALRRAKHEELEARGKGDSRRGLSLRERRSGRASDSAGTSLQWGRLLRGGTYPDLTAEQLNQLAAKEAAWWKDLRDPLFHKETNFENLIIPEMQLQRYQDLDELATLYGFDSVLLRTTLKLTSQQLDVFLNEYAPNARTSLGEDDRAFNMKAMTLIRKIRSKLDKAAGEVEWYKHANPRDPRDYDARIGVVPTTRDTPHSADDYDTILLKQVSFDEAMAAWDTWPQQASELSVAKLDDAITYVYHKHEESGKVFNREG